eukprot:TRINITY_DN17407_c0_g1_i1.p1 TRINITY_DN17407_c0_g1~~TRINITY_DN17407_c0_g1_i1.p1  ORF type:complete len:350 (+),score=102.86 TRINITY_DN17407_c0_g1_i1:56-1051(+)
MNLEIKNNLEEERKRRIELLEGVEGLRSILNDAMAGSKERLKVQLKEEQAAREGRIDAVRRDIAAMLEGGECAEPTATGTLLIEDEEEIHDDEKHEDAMRTKKLRERALLLIAQKGLPKVQQNPQKITPQHAISTPKRPPDSPKPHIVQKASSPAVEKQRYTAALKALRKDAVAHETEKEMRKKELLEKTKRRLDTFCDSKGFGKSKKERETTAVKLAAQRHRQLSGDRDKQEQARKLKEEYMKKCKEDERKMYLEEISNNVQSRKTTSPRKPPAPKKKIPPNTWSAVPITDDTHDVWATSASADYEDVRRVTVNLFDPLISDPASPTRAA